MLSILDGSSSFLQVGIKDNYKSFNEFDFQPRLTTNYRVSSLAALELSKIKLYNVLTILAHSFFIFIFILVGNKDIHKSMDEFEFCSDLITDYGLVCPCASEKYSFTSFLRNFYSDLYTPGTKYIGGIYFSPFL